MVEIVNTRVDERLVHGQIIANWAKRLKASRIVVMDDDAATSIPQQDAFKLAIPSDLKLSVLPVKEGVARLKEAGGAEDGESWYVLFRGPRQLKEAIEAGYPADTITVGELPNRIGSHRINQTTFVTDEDVELFHQLAEEGIHFQAQLSPSDEPSDFIARMDVKLAE